MAGEHGMAGGRGRDVMKPVGICRKRRVSDDKTPDSAKVTSASALATTGSQQ